MVNYCGQLRPTAENTARFVFECVTVCASAPPALQSWIERVSRAAQNEQPMLQMPYSFKICPFFRIGLQRTCQSGGADSSAIPFPLLLVQYFGFPTGSEDLFIIQNQNLKLLLTDLFL